MHTSEENLETKTKSQSFLQKKSAGLATRKTIVAEILNNKI